MMKIKKLFEYETIKLNKTIAEAIDLLNEAKHKILFVVDEGMCLKGTITDGDVRRFLRKVDINLKKNIVNIYNTNFHSVSGDSLKKIKDYSELSAFNVNYLPVLNDKSQILYVFALDINFQLKEMKKNKVVIMAGGKGTRMLPLTKIIPKPLIPYKEKTIIENIMNKFITSGFDNFIFTLNYKKEMIIDYFQNLDYKIDYIKEKDRYLGTAGSIAYLDDYTDEPFFVSNCDVLLDIDFNEALEAHKKEMSDITIIGSLEKYKIAYGILESDQNGKFSDIKEKPYINYLINTGIYIISPGLLKLIKKEEVLDMPDLIKKAKKNNKKISVFAVTKKMEDFGNLVLYKNTL